VPTAGPTNVSEVPAVSVLYHQEGLFCVRRLAPPKSVAQLRFNDTQLTCDKNRLRTADSVKVCHSPILHLRSNESTQLTERGFFVWQWAKVYRRTPKHKQLVCKLSIVMTDVSFWNWSVRKEIAAQQVTCCWRLESTITCLHIPDLPAAFWYHAMGFFFLVRRWWRSVVSEVR